MTDDRRVEIEHPNGERKRPWDYVMTVFTLIVNGKEVDKISFPIPEGDEIRWYRKLTEDDSYWMTRQPKEE